MQEPEFIEHGNTFAVIFKAKEVLHTIRVKEEKTDQLTSRQKAIVELLQKNDSLSFTDVMSKLEKPPSEKTLKRDLSMLKKLNIVDVRGKTWSAVWFLRQK
jgi:predicted HTH transcriptional regulator